MNAVSAHRLEMSGTEPSFRERLAANDIVVAPGVYDGLTALLAEQAGFKTLYLSGAAFAYSRLGRPDLGLVAMTEVAEHVELIRDRVSARLIVDADTGFGNALNVQRTVRMFERAGANAIQLEDQAMPKRCGHLAGKTLVRAGEMVGKIRAAVDARHNEDTLVIARTDAIAVEGLQQAIDRAASYGEAGADVLFVEAPQTVPDIQKIGRDLDKWPLMANMVEGGKTPLQDAAELQRLGFSIVIFPGGVARVLARAAQDFYRALAADGSTEQSRARMLDFEQLNEVLGTPQLVAEAKAYDGG